MRSDKWKPDKPYPPFTRALQPSLYPSFGIYTGTLTRVRSKIWPGCNRGFQPCLWARFQPGIKTWLHQSLIGVKKWWQKGTCVGERDKASPRSNRSTLAGLSHHGRSGQNDTQSCLVVCIKDTACLLLAKMLLPLPDRFFTVARAMPHTEVWKGVEMRSLS